MLRWRRWNWIPNWLRAKAHYIQWKEEHNMVRHEMQWTIKYLRTMGTEEECHRQRCNWCCRVVLCSKTGQTLEEVCREGKGNLLARNTWFARGRLVLGIWNCSRHRLQIWSHAPWDHMTMFTISNGLIRWLSATPVFPTSITIQNALARLHFRVSRKLIFGGVFLTF